MFTITDLTDADALYTTSIMRSDELKYTDKEIVILGGGDGALLNEILKQQPKFVVMLEVG